MENLKEKTARGLMWGLFNNGTTQVLNLAFGIVLARLLSPGEYGVVGVLAIFSALAGDLQSAGYSQALVNIRQPEDRDYNAVFWFNVTVSVAAYMVLFLAAPLIARFFHQPCLVSVSRFVFLCVVISALGIAHNAYLWKNLMVREAAICNMVALLSSGTTGIVLALLDFSYWSLAWQQVVYISVSNLMRLRYSRWRPSLRWDFEPIRRMTPFAVNVLFSKILTTLSGNVLTFIFGHLYPIHAVGNFTQANKWSTMGQQTVTGAIGQVAQPVMAEVGDDALRERRVTSKMLRFISFVSFPVLMGLAMVAREFILFTIGPKWLDCVPLLQMLCVAGAFMPLYSVFQNLMLSRGHSKIYMWCNAVQLVLQVVLVIAFASEGIQHMVAVFAAFNIAYLVVWQHFAHQLYGISWLQTLRDILPFLIGTIAVMTATYITTRTIASQPLLLLTRIVMAAALYFVLMKLLGAKILDECIRFILRKN